MVYTVEIYKLNRNAKGGMVLSFRKDFKGVELAELERQYPVRPRYVRFIKVTGK